MADLMYEDSVYISGVLNKIIKLYSDNFDLLNSKWGSSSNVVIYKNKDFINIEFGWSANIFKLFVNLKNGDSKFDEITIVLNKDSTVIDSIIDNKLYPLCSPENLKDYIFQLSTTNMDDASIFQYLLINQIKLYGFSMLIISDVLYCDEEKLDTLYNETLKMIKHLGI